MDFIKRQMYLIVCILVGGAGIALGITGYQGMPKIMEQMKSAESIYRNLDGLRSNPVNEDRLNAEQDKIDMVIDDRNKVIDHVKKLYGYTLLVDDVLPYGNAQSRLAFRKRYHDEMNNLLEQLTWGSIPSNADTGLMRDKIEDERTEGLYKNLGPDKSPAGVLTKAGILQNPHARAALWNAQRIYCYAVGFIQVKALGKIVPSLSYEPSMVDIDIADPPYPDEVWRAQLNYWIQSDVIQAIVALNEEAAQQAESSGAKPWVGIMPVKDVISVRLSDLFVSVDGDNVYGNPAGDTTEALPPGTPVTVFTNNASGDSFDVIQFTVKLVMDNRDIPLFIEKICNNRMHTLLRVSYKAEPVNKKFEGKIYGSDPAVNVVMDFETILMGDMFRKWMPLMVREENAVICRDIDQCVEPEDEEG